MNFFKNKCLKQKHKMHPTCSLGTQSQASNMCMPTYACKYRSIIQFCKRGKKNIRETSTYNVQQNKTKNFKVHFMDRTRHNMNFFKTNVWNKTQNASHTFTSSTQSQASNMHAYLLLRNFSFLKEHDSNVLPEPPSIYTAPPCVLIFISLTVMRDVHTVSARTKPNIIKCISWIEQKTTWTFSKSKVRNKHKMHPTHSQHSISSPTCACQLTSCKYRSIIQFVKRKTKISVRHPHAMCDRTKPKIIKCISRIEQDTTWTFFLKTNVWNKTQKCILHVHSTQSQASNMCMPTYALQLSIDRTILKRKIRETSAYNVQQNKTKNHKVHSMDRTKHNMNFSKNKGPKQNTKCIRHIHSTQSQVSNMCMPTYALQIPIDRTVL